MISVQPKPTISRCNLIFLKPLVKKAFVVFLALCSSVLLRAQKYEAENATLTGNAEKTSSTEASGGFFVAQKDGNLIFNVKITEEGFYNLFINAASPGGKKINSVYINGGSIDFTFQQSTSFKTLKVIAALKLEEGEHEIRIVKSWGWINIDFIQLEQTDGFTRFDINKTLVTPNPIDEAVRLYQFLYDNYGEKIISGAMTLNSMDEINWLKAATGKKPALVGLDFMQCGRGYNWYNDNEPVVDAKNYYNQNGIPAFCWHWRDPLRKTEAFYTSNTDFDVSKINDKNSPEYKAMVNDIDYISGLLKKLQDDGVPVLWRPLHEASGGWFWWGAKGAEPCKKLYQLIYKRMVHFHGLKNLIWVWTSQQDDWDWYPGDSIVDIIGRDIYKEGDHSSQILEFMKLNNQVEGKKMITLSECGSFPDVDNLMDDEAEWSYFMPWYGDFVRNSKYNSLDLWKKMFAHDYVITLDEMPDLKTYTTPEKTWRSLLYPENWKPGYKDAKDRFLHDFSYAGYHQGEKEIPFFDENVVDVTMPPYNVDNTGTENATDGIQKAIEDVGIAGGGVVFMPAGTYIINPGNNENALRIRFDKTILRGAGKDSTFLLNTASAMRQKNIIYIMDDWCTWSDEYGNKTKLAADLLYPTRVIPVESVTGFKAGDEIILRTDGTPAFIEEHKMAGIWEDWAARVMHLRTIDSVDVENRLIYIDSPTRYFMKMRDNARIYHAKKHIEECAIENLSIGNIQNNKPGWDEESYTTNGTGAYDVHASHAIYFKYAKNCWVKNVNTFKPDANTEDIHLLSNCLLLNQCRNITVDSCFFQKPQYEGGGGNGYMFTLSSNDCLIQNCRANHSRHNYDFKMAYSNGNVIHNCIGENSKYSSDFHMYLSMSNLIDCFTVDADYLESTFRPWGGNVIHGYSSTQSVFYNTKGISYHPNRDYIIESRQFGNGYIIGTSGNANRVKLDPTSGSINAYNFDTAPRDWLEGMGKGNELEPQSLFLDQLNKRLNDSTGIPVYNVQINIIHSFSGQPVENCSVNILNKQAFTNSAGNAFFSKVHGLLILNFEKEGFYPETNKQLTIYSDTVLTFSLTPVEYKVRFFVFDQSTSEPVVGTIATFNSVSEVTNINGEVEFRVYNGEFEFTINNQSFKTINQTFRIQSDTVFNIYLERLTAWVKFRLKEGTTPVNNATVILNTDSLVSNAIGIANFRDLQVNETYDYLVYKQGYNDLSGTFVLLTDTTLSLQMEPYATVALQINEGETKIWPNPVDDKLIIHLPPQFNIVQINVHDLHGNLVRTFLTFEEKKQVLGLAGLKSGFYLLNIITNQKNIQTRFIKK